MQICTSTQTHNHTSIPLEIKSTSARKLAAITQLIKCNWHGYQLKQPKRPQDKNRPGKVKKAHNLFTNDTSCLNNSAYHVYAYKTHMVIMHAYEVQMHYTVCGVTQRQFHRVRAGLTEHPWHVLINMQYSV